MLETRPPLAICCDDLNSTRALDNIERVNLPIHGDVIVTDVEKYQNITQFVAENRARLAKVEPGVHISLFEGKFPEAKRGKQLFGEEGLLHRMLHEVEHPHAKQTRHFRSHFNRWAANALRNHEKSIRDEMHRQVDFWKTLFGEEPRYLSYHFGMHFIPFLHNIYVAVAQERDLPYRHATQYTGMPARGTLFVYDGLNDGDVTGKRVLTALEKIKKRGKPTEIMVHFGESGYGEVQTRAFLDPRVRSELAHWRIEMPHVLWNRLHVGHKRAHSAADTGALAG
jgi:hypothetical protein